MEKVSYFPKKMYQVIEAKLPRFSIGSRLGAHVFLRQENTNVFYAQMHQGAYGNVQE
jgi:hypothetical protein